MKKTTTVAGLAYFLTMVAGVVAQVFIGDLGSIDLNVIYPGFSIYMIEMVLQVVAFALIMFIFQPFNKALAITAGSLGLVGCTIKSMSRLFFVAPTIINMEQAQNIFDSVQIDFITHFLINLGEYGAAIALIFFGLHSVLNGILVLKAERLPNYVGLTFIVGGAGWLTFFYLPLGFAVFMIAALLGLIGVAIISFWLVFKGVAE